MAFLNSIEYWERVRDPASPQEAFRPDGASATRTLDCDWNNREEFAWALLGYAEVKNIDTSSAYLSRHIPDWHPDFTIAGFGSGDPYMYATQIRGIEGIAWRAPYKSPDDVALYELARCTVQYESLQYDVLSDADMIARGYVDSRGNPDESTLKRYVIKKSMPAVEYLSLPQGYLKYVQGPNDTKGQPVIGAGVGKIVPKADVVIQWIGVPETAIPYKAYNSDPSNPETVWAIDNTLGKINSKVFNKYPVGTLLLVAADPMPRRDPFGQRVFDIEYRMSYFPFGHNNIYYKADNGAVPATDPPIYAYNEVSTDGKTHLPTVDGTHIYDAADFSKLFKIPGSLA